MMTSFQRDHPSRYLDAHRLGEPQDAAVELGLGRDAADIASIRGSWVAATAATAASISRPHNHGDIRLHQRIFGSRGGVIARASRETSESDTWQIMPVRSGPVTYLGTRIDDARGAA